MEVGAGNLTPTLLSTPTRVPPIPSSATFVARAVFLCQVTAPGMSSQNVIALGKRGTISLISHTALAIRCGPAYLLTELPPCLLLTTRFSDPNIGYCRLALVMSFCWAIHKTINQIRSGRDALNADIRAEALTVSLSNIWRKPSKKGR